MGSFLSTTSHVADSEVFPEEMKDIFYLKIQSPCVLNSGTKPVATEPEPHTQSVEELLWVSKNLLFCGASTVKKLVFFLLSQQSFTVVVLQGPPAKLRERSYSGGDAMTISCEASQPLNQQFSV